MSSLHFATLFLPEWALPWIMVSAIAAWILGARAVASLLGIILFIELVLAPLLAPLLETIPMWLFLVLFPFLVLLMIHGLIAMVFGGNAAGQFTGTYLVRLVDLLLLGPFRLLGGLLRMLSR